MSIYSRALLASTLGAVLSVLTPGLAAADDPPPAQGFSFSGQAAKDQAQADADAAARSQSIQSMVSAPCRQRLKDRRILLLIGEKSSSEWQTSQDQFSQFFKVIETRLNGLGLKTYTQQQLKASIAQAEVEAYFKNDPDAALAASKRMGANYILRGTITSTAGVNTVVQVNEVTVGIDLTLSANDGRVLSDVNAHSGSYSGSDTMSTALQLVKEQADLLVAQLYNDYCHGGK